MNLEQLYAEIANGNEEAYKFIIAWQDQSHKLDDIIDNCESDPEVIIETMLSGQDLVLCPFFLQYKATLYPLHFLALSNYADSIKWSRESVDYKQRIADIIRSCGNDMLLTVCAICSNPEEEVAWRRIRRLSLILRELSYVTHHDKKGFAV